MVARWSTCPSQSQKTIHSFLTFSATTLEVEWIQIQSNFTDQGNGVTAFSKNNYHLGILLLNLVPCLCLRKRLSQQTCKTHWNWFCHFQIKEWGPIRDDSASKPDSQSRTGVPRQACGEGRTSWRSSSSSTIPLPSPSLPSTTSPPSMSRLR